MEGEVVIIGSDKAFSKNFEKAEEKMKNFLRRLERE